MNHIKQFPHCDAKVLHAPSENCVHCNAHPDWQELRKYWGIAYTGHSNELIEYKDYKGELVVKTLIPCPSEWDRPVETINKWHGNTAMTTERMKETEEYFKNLRNILEEKE